MARPRPQYSFSPRDPQSPTSVGTAFGNAFPGPFLSTGPCTDSRNGPWRTPALSGGGWHVPLPCWFPPVLGQTVEDKPIAVGAVQEEPLDPGDGS